MADKICASFALPGYAMAAWLPSLKRERRCPVSNYDWDAAEKYLKKISRKIPRRDRANIRRGLDSKNEYYFGRIIQTSFDSVEKFTQSVMLKGFDQFAGKA